MLSPRFVATASLSALLICNSGIHTLSFSPKYALTSRNACKLQATTTPLPPTQQQLQHRREFLTRLIGASSSVAFMPLLPSEAVEGYENLADQLYNPDGTLKEGVEAEAKERTVGVSWDICDGLCLLIDGDNRGSNDGKAVDISYKLPMKWSNGKDGDELYYDRSEGTNAKACKRITVYQAPGVADIKRLQKAATIGVAKALDVPSALSRLGSADIISGRVAKRDGQTYYEYDMAAAPETCSNSKENLGLGFCPYDNIFLLSATIVNDRLYVIAVECDSTRIWKLASAELKRVRSSFTVQEIA